MNNVLALSKSPPTSSVPIGGPSPLPLADSGGAHVPGAQEGPPLSFQGPPVICICPSDSSCRRSLPLLLLRDGASSLEAVASPQIEHLGDKARCREDCGVCAAWGAFCRGCRVSPAVLGAFISVTFSPFKSHRKRTLPLQQQQQHHQQDVALCARGEGSIGPPSFLLSINNNSSSSTDRKGRVCCWYCNPYRRILERVLHCGFRGKEGFNGHYHRLVASHELGIRVFLSIDPRFIKGVSYAARTLSLKCLSKVLLALLYQTLICTNSSSTRTTLSGCCCCSSMREDAAAASPNSLFSTEEPVALSLCSSRRTSSSSISPAKKHHCRSNPHASEGASRVAAAPVTATAAAAAITGGSPLTSQKGCSSSPAPKNLQHQQQQERKHVSYLGCCGSRLCSGGCCCSNSSCLSLFCTPSEIWGVRAVRRTLAAAAASGGPRWGPRWGPLEGSPAAEARRKYRWWLRDKPGNPAELLLLQRLRVLLPDVLLLRLAQLLAAADAAATASPEGIKETKMMLAAELAAMVAAFPLDTQQQQHQQQQQLLMQQNRNSVGCVSSDAEDQQQQQGYTNSSRSSSRSSREEADASTVAEVCEQIRASSLDFLCVLLHLSCCHAEHRRCCIVRCRDIAVASDALGAEDRKDLLQLQQQTAARRLCSNSSTRSSNSISRSTSRSRSSSSDGSWYPASSSSSSSSSEEEAEEIAEEEGHIPGLQVCVADSGEGDGNIGGTAAPGMFMGGGHRMPLQDYLSCVVNCRCGCADADCDPDEETESEGAGSALEDTSSSSEED